LIRSDDKLFGWTDSTWLCLDDSIGFKVATGKDNRLYKVAYDTDKVFQ